MWHKWLAVAKKECKTLFVYGFVGGTSFGVKVIFYGILSRVIWPTGSRSIQNIIAIMIAVIYNYTLHSHWTFRERERAPGTFLRYLSVVVFTVVLDASMFTALHEWLRFYDIGVLVFNGGAIAIVGFLSHRLFTFHHDPWKRMSS